MIWSDAVVHWLHLMAAILWVGGTLATSLVIHPVLRAELSDSARMAVYREIGKRFTKVQWWSWGILAATGAVKLWGIRGTPEIFFGPFGHVLAVKLALVAGMVALSLIHALVWGPALASRAGDAAARAALARRAAFWGKINGLLMIAIVFCAALLRYNPW
jgi:putative copper resistance protein D